MSSEGGQFGEIDVSAEGKVKTKFIPELNRQLQLINVVENWTETKLILWLFDRNLVFTELTSQEKEVFLTALVSDLLDNRSMSLSQLVRKKFELRKIADEKIKGYREEAPDKSAPEITIYRRRKRNCGHPGTMLYFSSGSIPSALLLPCF